MTASWDGLIGLWDTTAPESDEVLEERAAETRKKRRKVNDDSKPMRKVRGNH